MLIRTTQIGLIVMAIAFWGSADAAEVTPEQADFFETKIRPVLVKRCYGCHSNESGNARGGLRLDTRELTHIGGSSGPAIVPGDLDGSLLFNAMTHQDFVMPPRSEMLPQAVIDDFRKWIEMGAPDPRSGAVTEIRSSIDEQQIQQAKAEFWAYQKPTRRQPPKADGDWSLTDIDRWIEAELAENQLAPSSDASAYTVARRLYFDLIGLPPTVRQIADFQKSWDRDPTAAIAAAADQLLQSPQFGERWGRHWLDVARYAESSGRGVNLTYPQAWRYRDYVIDSFNSDKPYDRFVQEQLAGDLLPVSSDEQWAENLIATGFLALGPKDVNQRNGTQFAADLVDEQIDVTTRVLIGTSIACARCHDHKFDPIPQTDYYAMVGIFGNMSTYFGVPASSIGIARGLQTQQTSNLLRMPIDDPNPFEKAVSPAELESMRERLATASSELREARINQRRPGATPVPISRIVRMTGEIEYLSAKLGGHDPQGNPISFCMGVQAKEQPKEVRLLVRGEIDQPAQVVPPGFPRVLSDEPASIADGSTGRLEFARWITDRDNPLTARVMVNRIWQHLLGQGIVASPENFGSTGSAPTHPELLDHLAVEFVESGWSVKSVIRQIVTSRVYRIDSEFDRSSFEKDPENKLLWRANMRRLDAEAIRDAMLFVSGKIDLDRPGASLVAESGYMRVRDGNLVNLFDLSGNASRGGMGAAMGGSMGMAAGAMQDRGSNQRRGRFGRNRQRGGISQTLLPTPGTDRLDMSTAEYRSVYLPVVRDEVPRALAVFDFAEPSMVVGQRESSSTPNQALFLMNNPFVIAQADALAQRVSEEAKTPAARLRLAFELSFGRSPNATEVSAIRRYLSDFEDVQSNRGRALAMTALCQSLLASADFRYLD
ncbi:PSD1 and planctomycete cytochrome C domain-containing protein [Rosistilla ulvae]|uniref:PSD1 and planctomycete cytochrome C domain-containing protein n=1 Tax=Rosistilla ulvae TaxID=1930277 RepID=UPI0028F43D42|nr:PSD1 and planctomycete cytochrome C domain-containing protein [Rosistilla ulvae]